MVACACAEVTGLMEGASVGDGKDTSRMKKLLYSLKADGLKGR